MSIEDRIRKELVRIKNATESTTSPRLILYYMRGFDGLKEFIQINELPIEIPEIDFDWDLVDSKLYIDDSFVSSYNQMYKTNIKISNMGRHLFERYGMSLLGQYTEKIHTNDAIHMAREFFKWYDEDIYVFFNTILKNRMIRFVDSCDEYIMGVTYDIKSMNCSLINIYNSETLDYAGTLIHETIHAYVNSKRDWYNYDDEINYKTMQLVEVYPEFIELVFLDYLEKTRFPSKDISAYGTLYNADLICDLMSFGDIINCNNAQDILASDDTFERFGGLQRYVYGRIMAYLYYERFKRNKEYTKEQILRMSLDSAKYDKKYLLNNYGLHEKDLYNEQKLIRSLQKFYNY